MQSQIQTRKKRYFGFTIIEFLIVLAVISTVAAIAYPSYQKYLRKSRRAEAQALLNSVLVDFEQFYAQHPPETALDIPYHPTQNYSYSLVKCTSDCNTGLIFYRALDKNSAGVPCVRIVASPYATSPQAADTECACIYLDSTGERTPSVCWN